MLLCDFVAGCVGGMYGVFCGYPWDTIKVRQQTQGLGPISCIANTWQYEGVRGFYKGMVAPLLASGALNSIFFGTYAMSLKLLQHSKRPPDPPAGSNNSFADPPPPQEAFLRAHMNSSQPSYWDIFLAGCVGGTAQLAIACPAEVVKIKLQNQTGTSKSWRVYYETRYKGPWDCLKRLYQDRGIRAWYQGLDIMFLRDVTRCGLHVVTYTWLMTSLCNYMHPDPISLTSATLLSAGTGMVSWGMIIPLDVVKSQRQAQNPRDSSYKSLWHCFKSSYAEGGLKVFSRGFWLITMRAFPVNAATFLAYEWMLGLCRSRSTTQNSSVS